MRFVFHLFHYFLYIKLKWKGVAQRVPFITLIWVNILSAYLYKREENEKPDAKQIKTTFISHIRPLGVCLYTHARKFGKYLLFFCVCDNIFQIKFFFAFCLQFILLKIIFAFLVIRKRISEQTQPFDLSFTMSC